MAEIEFKSELLNHTIAMTEEPIVQLNISIIYGYETLIQDLPEIHVIYISSVHLNFCKCS